MAEPVEIQVDEAPRAQSWPDGVDPLRQIALELARANALLEALVSLMVPQDEPEEPEPLPPESIGSQHKRRELMRRRFASRRA